MKQFVALSGLPRSGSTLLSAILDQNPNIHAPGNSPVCQMMWDLQLSATRNEQIKATKRQHRVDEVLKSIPHSFYSDIEKEIIIDKCRSWTLPLNTELLMKVVPKPQIIIMIRPVDEIVKSYINLLVQNNKTVVSDVLLLSDFTEPIMRSFEGVRYVLSGHSKADCMFITYKNLVENTEQVIDEIYRFIGVSPFRHKFNNIFYKHKEDDSVYNVPGMHDVRKKIGYRSYDIKLSDEAQEKCDNLNKMLQVVFKK